MNFKRVLQEGFDFRGRLTRRAFYWQQVMNGMALIFFSVFFIFGTQLFGWWSAPLALPLILAAIARAKLLVLRMHDLGYSGYWLLTAPASLAAALLVAALLGTPWMGLSWAFLLLAVTLTLVFGIQMNWIEGKKGANRFGAADPLDENRAI